jgi:TolA-binding protein
MYAEASFYSQQYPQALTQYLRVRNFKKETDRLEEAAFSAVLSHMNIVDQAVKSKQLPYKVSLLLDPPADPNESESAPLDTSDTSETSKKTDTSPLPPLVNEAIKLRQEYIDFKLDGEETPQRTALFIYQIGEMYADFRKYNLARDQFKVIIKNHLKSKVAMNAAIRLIDTYQKEKNWVKVAEWADKIASSGIQGELVSQAQIWKVGALFKTAEQLYKDKKYAQSGKEYIKLVDQNPKNEFAAKALNNGAVAFEKARMFESATRVYERIFNYFPNSEFSENALFRVAYNSERFYNYDKAVETFNDLVKRYPDGKHVEDASYNVARLFEQTQQYQKAAKAYERFSSRFSESEQAADTLYSAALNYEKLKDTRN